MAGRGRKSVDEAIEQVAEASDDGLSGVQERLTSAQQALEGARATLQHEHSTGRQPARRAADRTRVYLDDAGRDLAAAKQGMSTVTASGRGQAELLYAKTKEQYEMLSDRAKELYEKAKDRVAEVDLKQKGDQVLEYIRANPGKSVLIALAAGFLIGYVTRPKE